MNFIPYSGNFNILLYEIGSKRNILQIGTTEADRICTMNSTNIVNVIENLQNDNGQCL